MRVLVMLTALVLLAPSAAADPPRGPPGALPAEGKVEKERLRQQIFDQLRAFRMWRITEELKLDEATAAKLFPLLAKFDEQERAIDRERGQTHREMHSALETPNPDAGRIDALVEKLVTLRARRHTLEQEKIAAVRRVLTPVQMGKLMAIMPRIEEGFRRKIRNAIDTARSDGLHGDSPRGKGRPRF